MSTSSRSVTNVLLVLVVLLLAANLVLPALKDRDPPSSAESTAEPSGEATTDDLVVRIPADVAREFGIEEKDVVKLVEVISTDPTRSRLLSARLNANETAAIVTLRNICSAQAQFQATAMVDLDNDGTGEHGSFRELSGAVAARGCSSPLNPPALSGAFRVVDEAGAVTRSGYRFLIYLPDADGKGVAADGADVSRIDAGKAEIAYCAYAWPERQGHSGHRTFLLSSSGDVFSTETEDYSGGKAPGSGAGFRDGKTGSILGEPAVGEAGSDGHVWRQVN